MFSHVHPDMTHEWSVHARVTISHNGDDASSVAPPPPVVTTSSGGDPSDNGVRMVYSWHSHPPQPQATLRPPTFAQKPPQKQPAEPFGFQRGNLIFTTTPPPRLPFADDTAPSEPIRVPNSDSGYTSEQLSSSARNMTLRRPSQLYNRRCRSTCSIVLSTVSEVPNARVESPSCARTQSLRSPNATSSRRSEGYECGDPWCYHTTTTGYVDEVPPSFGRTCPFSPVLESCEVCDGNRSPNRPSRAHTVTTHFCTKLPERSKAVAPQPEPPVKTNKDAASQTSYAEEVKKTNRDAKKRNKTAYDYRRLTDSIIATPTFLDPTLGLNRQSGKRLSRSPARRGRRDSSPVATGKSSDGSSASQSTETRKPRTVHIDVYCTGSDEDDADAGSSTDEDVASSPQTVFESEKIRVQHKRAGKSDMPKALQDTESLRLKTNEIPNKDVLPETPPSDDGFSCSYPSAASSYSTIRTTSLSSLPPSWSTMSNSSCALFADEYDSAAATSWKDTVSDMESLMHSGASLAQSDSFEYANSEDKDRIKAMEQVWTGNLPDADNTKKWRSPQVERKYLLQQRKMNDYMKKKLPKWGSDSDDADDNTDDESEQGWTFACDKILSNSAGISKNDTVRRASKDKTDVVTPPVSDPNALSVDTASPSDSSPSTVKSYSHRMTIGPFGGGPVKVEDPLKSKSTSPFAVIPGYTMDHMAKALKFGTIVGVLKKPGHHVGPSKNPDCSCEHCRRYYEDREQYRNRTMSAGDLPVSKRGNWRQRFLEQ